MVIAVEPILGLGLLYTFASNVMKRRLEELAEQRCALTCHCRCEQLMFPLEKAEKSKESNSLCLLAVIMATSWPLPRR